MSLRRWRRYLAEVCHDSQELRFKLKILVWLHSTESGDRSELRLHGKEEVMWARIASDPLDCVGIHCTKEDCYVHRARAEAEAADLVVINHALLLADAEVGGGLLPQFDHLVIDEAHHLEEAATRGLRQEVDGPGLAALLDRLGGGETPGKGLLDELRRQPHLGASGEALAQAQPLTLVAAQRVRELFESAVVWVGARLNDAERRDELCCAFDRDHPGKTPRWEQIRVAGENAATALAALDGALRKAVSGSSRLARRRRARPGGERARDHPRAAQWRRCAPGRGARVARP